MIRVVLPYGLRMLAAVPAEIELDAGPSPTLRSTVEAMEARYPALRGTIVDPQTGRRRALLRIFACRLDLSHASPDSPLPAAVASGDEPLLVVGAIAGG